MDDAAFFIQLVREKLGINISAGDISDYRLPTHKPCLPLSYNDGHLHNKENS